MTLGRSARRAARRAASSAADARAGRRGAPARSPASRTTRGRVAAGPRVRRAQGPARRRRRVRARRRSRAAPSASSPRSRRPPASHVPWIVVADARLALARARRRVLSAIRAARCASSASPAPTARRRPRTCCASIFEAAGIRCGLLGTVVYRIGDEVREATRTTPEAPDVQRLLREMVDRGCGACVMEVSSHALALRASTAIDVRGRGVHEPDARPPRLPRRHGELLRARSGACSRCCRASAPA